MKQRIILQANGSEVEIDAFVVDAKQAWKDAGNKVKEIKTLDIYVKPEESKCYYVINDDFSGAVEL
jgi:spore coat polysaccharide biosynthesis protein SpsF (cytidylyltransferase family)